MKYLKYKEGYILCIDADNIGHQYEMGELVTVLELIDEPYLTDEPHYRVTNGIRQRCVLDEEVNLYKSKKQQEYDKEKHSKKNREYSPVTKIIKP